METFNNSVTGRSVFLHSGVGSSVSCRGGFLVSMRVVKRNRG